MKNLLAVLTCAALLGCGTADVSGNATPDEGDADALTGSSSYFTLRADTRACPSPLCGGYFVAPVNSTRPEAYVSALDFTRTTLAVSEIAKVQGAPAGELVLHGKLSGKSRSTGTRRLLVTDAYRGMPGAIAAGRFFSVKHTPRQCIAAPCNQDAASALNGSAVATDVTTISVDSAAMGFVDTDWLVHRVQTGGALVAASLIAGAQYPAGTEQVLDATQVFLHLPEGMGPCPALMQLNCAATGQLNTFVRNADRCIIPTGCESPGVCSMMMPNCASGYTATSYRSQNHACPSVTCDPTWILQ
jgi:hypothetical protein